MNTNNPPEGFQVEGDEREVDLVCGMEVSNTAEHGFVHKGKRYAFCSTSCKEHFENDPEKYIG